jgi:hypothetical protein
MNESEIQRKSTRLAREEIYLNMSSIIAELLRHDPELLEDMSNMYNHACPQCGEFFEYDVALDEYGEVECEACKESVEPELEPKEIYEYWAVSSWLARKLAEAGEAVHTDVCGHNIWGRCTTGQAISMDHVIREMVRP